MGEVLPLPSRGDVFEDLRGEGRTLRVSWHTDERTLVLSIWHLGQCRATFRLPSGQVPDLVRSLVVAGLTEGRSCGEGASVALHPSAGPGEAGAVVDMEATTDDAGALLRAAGISHPLVEGSSGAAAVTLAPTGPKPVAAGQQEPPADVLEQG
jgi:hypothetical protein